MDGTKLIKDKKSYRDLLAVSEYVDDLIKYCEQQYTILATKIANDAAKNEQLRYDYQEFDWKESYDTKFRITAYDAVHSFVYFDSFAAYRDAAAKHTLSALNYIEIELNLSYCNGRAASLIDHKRDFVIRFEQNDSYFAYESNEEDENFNSIRDAILNKLDQFPAVRTIFSRDEVLR